MTHRMYIPFFRLAAVLCMSLLTLSCGSGGGPTPQPPSAKPVITSFAVNPASITVGSDSTLSWKVSNATHLAIEPGIGDITGSSSRSVSRYGMILADTGSNLFIQGTRDARWVENADQGGVAQLLRVPPSAFEVLAHSVEYTRSSHPIGSAPSITSLTAMPGHVSSGGIATLNWSVTGASTLIISPSVGPVRGTSVVIHPTSTTTYTLYGTNEFGRSHANVTVNVP